MTLGTPCGRAVETALKLMANAREGSALLCSGAPPLFSTRAMAAPDWDWLLSLTDPTVQDAWRGDGGASPLFSDERRAVRRAADAWTASLFDKYRCHSCD